MTMNPPPIMANNTNPKGSLKIKIKVFETEDLKTKTLITQAKRKVKGNQILK